MIKISEDVIEALYEALTESGIAEGDALRLTAGADDYRLELDEPTREDRVIWFRDSPILAIAPSIEAALNDAVIELSDSEEGDRLMLVIRTDG